MNIIFLHNFFAFLGSTEGYFLKRVLELVVFTIVTYMIISEYIRDKRIELKFLMYAFGALLIQKFLIVSILFVYLYAQLKLVFYIFAPAIEHLGELIGMILIGNAFVYPLLDDKRLKSYTRYEIYIVVSLSVIFGVLWVALPDYSSICEFLFVSAKIIALGTSIFMIFISKKEIRYRADIIAALIAFLFTPVINLINILFFHNLSHRLVVFQHPFPILAALLLLRVIYFKLVDKAYLKEKLERSETELKQEKELSEMKDHFISVVSHELRTPLTSIKLYISLLKDKMFGPVTDKQAEALEIVKSESDRLSNLINDVLDLNKLEAKKVEINLAEFNLAELKEDLYIKTAAQKGISVNLDIPNPMIIKVDKDKFRQIYINLLGNAVKFTDSGGNITIGAEDYGRSWRFYVKDTGIGIKEEHKKRLFDKFYQVEDHMTRNKGGTGLGLPIVKNLVELHKGSIHVESEYGKGSNFIVTLPKDIN